VRVEAILFLEDTSTSGGTMTGNVTTFKAGRAGQDDGYATLVYSGEPHQNIIPLRVNVGK